LPKNVPGLHGDQQVLSLGAWKLSEIGFVLSTDEREGQTPSKLAAYSSFLCVRMKKPMPY